MRLPFSCSRAMLLLVALCGSLTLPAQSSDAILQGFYWNTHPGDHTDGTNGGIWWDSLALRAAGIAGAGFQTLWVPPPAKGFGGQWDMGYGIKDYYDLGQYNQNGSVRTRHGNLAQFSAMMDSLHGHGLSVMADIVLNHRGGGDGQAPYEVSWGYPNGLPWVIFNPASGRFPGVARHFHPTNAHPDQNADYHNPLFFEDLCYFNNVDVIPPPGGWYNGEPVYGLGEVGDSLIAWGRWLMNDIGFDEMRLDAVKHIDHAFLAKFLTEVRPGTQPYAVGESFDYDIADLEYYHNAVTTSPNSGIDPAAMSLFDFPLRGILKNILNNTSGTADLYNDLGGKGLVWGSALSGFDVVTWLDNHDTDRIGYVGAGAAPCDPGEITFGNGCLDLEDSPPPGDHDPIFSDKEDMGYPLIMAAEGRPSVFWKDYFWYGMEDDVRWLMALRQATAQGASEHIQSMNGFWPDTSPFDGDNNGGNMFAMRRNGLGTTDRMVLGLNDHPSKTLGVRVNTPFQNVYLKDYSDGLMFVTQQAFNDTRAFITAQPRDYTWWALTGLYPHPPGVPASRFTMDAAPGGAVHFIALDAGDAASFLVNGTPIEPGDEIAIINAGGEICGIGRIGQQFGWDGTHDMLIEVIGPIPTASDPLGISNGMGVGESFTLVVYDRSAGAAFQTATISFAGSGTGLTFNPLRPDSPNRNGNVSSFPLTTSATGTFAAGSISRITGFDASVAFAVEGLTFTGRVLDQTVQLDWTTAREEQNAGFEVQMRPADRDTFEVLGFVAGSGTSSIPQAYRFITPALEPGSYVFRLQQIDFDGQRSSGPQLHMTLAAPRFELVMQGNPFGASLTFEVRQDENNPLHAELCELSGRVLRSSHSSSRRIAWDTSDLPGGVYLLRVRNGRQELIRKVVKL